MNHAINKESNNVTPNTQGIKESWNLYDQFSKSFGGILLVLFSTSSFLTIVNTFFVFSAFFTGVQAGQIFTCIGLGLSAVGHLICMLSIVLGLDKAQNNLLALSDVLDILEETLEKKAEKVKVKNLRRKIMNSKPISGLGFFNIDKNSFVAMLSFAATYIVILVQFRTS